MTKRINKSKEAETKVDSVATNKRVVKVKRQAFTAALNKNKNGTAAAVSPAPPVAAKAKPSHPPFLDMVTEAIKNSKLKTGSSRQAISKYIAAHYQVDHKTAGRRVKLILKNGVISGKFKQPKGAGVKGSFMLATESDKSAPKKPKTQEKENKPAKKVKEVKKSAKKPQKTESVKKTKSKKTVPDSNQQLIDSSNPKVFVKKLKLDDESAAAPVDSEPAEKAEESVPAIESVSTEEKIVDPVVESKEDNKESQVESQVEEAADKAVEESSSKAEDKKDRKQNSPSERRSTRSKPTKA